MNNGILSSGPAPVAMPGGLLGRPTPVQMPSSAEVLDAAIATDASGAVIPPIDTTMAGMRYVTHVFRTVGSGRLTFLRDTEAQYLVVGGGGAGGSWYGGGGGGGGLLRGAATFVRGDYAVAVGNGGMGVAAQSSGTSGSNSALGSLLAFGGGGGGAYLAAGKSGGSGGGGFPGGSGVAGQGNSALPNNGIYGGGGGGAGSSPPPTAAALNNAGGSGIASSLSGTLTDYAKGGIGSYSGAYTFFPNSGGGGVGQYSNGVAGQTGMSGIVAVRYRRSAAPIHPEAEQWLFNVYGNGGTVKMTTLQAVSRFCYAIDDAGIRDRFYRLNLFCGDQLAAALVPLYRSTSATSTQYGNLIDANSNFVSADYQESGTLSGLTKLATGTTKVLNTGLRMTALPQVQTLHIAASVRNYYAAGFVIGQSGAGVSANMYISNANSFSGGIANEWGGFAQSTPGRFLLSRTSSTVGVAYRNASAYTTNTTDVGTLTAGDRTIAVFGLGNNTNGAVVASACVRLNGYSFGNSMTAAQAAAYDAAIVALEAALGRQ